MSNSEIPEAFSSKAGRHRLYSNEQRKDRNRQAQAAFRDRRSKYTKTLEVAILKFEDTIEKLKAENIQSLNRASVAEKRCAQLNLEVNHLQKLLQMALAENQRLSKDKGFLDIIEKVILTRSKTNLGHTTPVTPPFDTEVMNQCSPTTTVSPTVTSTDYLFSSLDDHQAPPLRQAQPQPELLDTSWLHHIQSATIGESIQSFD